MKEKSHRATHRCYRSGVWTLHGTQTWRLDGHSLYSAQRPPGPWDFEADHRPVRPAARQLGRRRPAAEGHRRPARSHLAIGQRHPRSAPAWQGGALAPGSAAAARLRAGLWLCRLQRRRAAGRRSHPQAAARARSARRGRLGVAADALAVRERGRSGGSLSARDGVGRRRADRPPRAFGRRRPAHHDRSRCDRRSDPRAAGVRPTPEDGPSTAPAEAYAPTATAATETTSAPSPRHSGAWLSRRTTLAHSAEGHPRPLSLTELPSGKLLASRRRRPVRRKSLLGYLPRAT